MNNFTMAVETATMLYNGDNKHRFVVINASDELSRYNPYSITDEEGLETFHQGCGVLFSTES